MFYRAITLSLVFLLVQGSMAAQDQSQFPQQTVAQMQKVLRQAEESNKAVKVTLKKKIDRQSKFKGTVSEISDSGFVLTNQKDGKIQTLNYEDIKKVNRTGLSRAGMITLIVVGGVVVAAIVVGEQMD